MGVRMLAEKAGQLQGMGPDTIARQVYGLNARFYPDPQGDNWPGYVGAIVTQNYVDDDGCNAYDLLDHVLEVHEV